MMDNVLSLDDARIDRNPDITHDPILTMVVERDDGSKVRIDILKDREDNSICLGIVEDTEEEGDELVEGEVILLGYDCDNFIYDKLIDALEGPSADSSSNGEREDA